MLKAGKQITNVGGYLSQAIEFNFAKSSCYQNRYEDSKKDIDSESLKLEYNSYCLELLEKRTSNLESIKLELLFKEYVSTLPENHFVRKYILRKERNHHIVQTCFNKYLMTIYLTEEELDFDRFKESRKTTK